MGTETQVMADVVTKKELKRGSCPQNKMIDKNKSAHRNKELAGK